MTPNAPASKKCVGYPHRCFQSETASDVLIRGKMPNQSGRHLAVLATFTSLTALGLALAGLLGLLFLGLFLGIMLLRILLLGVMLLGVLLGGPELLLILADS